MCNPNSSVANRRYRHAALQAAAASSSASLLTQKLVGSLTTSKVTSNHASASYLAIGDIESTQPTTMSPIKSYEMSFSNYDRHHEPQRHTYNLQRRHEAEAKPEPSKAAKRRRKPQQPGMTAKNQERHFVQHHYHDHANDPDDDDSDNDCRRRGGVAVSFPVQLHRVLEQVEADGFGHVISWSSHGRCFVIHNPKEFADVVMPKYFRQSKLTSFQRQLNLYGFVRLTRGEDIGGYYHELFLRGKDYLLKRMVRTKVKGTKFKAASSPEQEPDFYAMPPVTTAIVTPNGSEWDNSEDESRGGTPETTAVASDSTTRSSHLSYQEAAFAPPGTYGGHEYQPQSRYPCQAFYPEEDAYTVQPHEAPLSPIVKSYGLQRYGTIGGPMGCAPPLHMTFPTTTSMPLPTAVPSALSQGFYDEAVEEIFLEDSFAANEIMEFVSAWDPTLLEEADVNDDIQLGNLLDKFLEG